MQKKILLLLIYSLIFNHTVFSQGKDMVSVDPNKGLATAVIPIYTLTRGGASFPINLIYAASGIKVQQNHDNAGMGWHLSASGRITRQVRGLPDDNRGAGDGSYKGWLSNSNGTGIDNFTISNDGNQSVCADETADINYINSSFNYKSDMEPDLFYVNAPGLNCQFVFDKDHQIRTIPYQDLKITYTVGSDQKINAFTVVDDKGTVYSFYELETTTKSAVWSTFGLAGNPDFFKAGYSQYKSPITYNSSWLLSSIYDSNNNGFSMNYEDHGQVASSSPVVLTFSSPHNLDRKNYQYSNVEIKNNNKLLTIVQSAKDSSRIEFAYGNAQGTADYIVTNIKVAGKDIIFDYGRVDGASGYQRSFLTSVHDRISSYPLNYKFGYIGYPNFSSSVVSGILPDTSSKQIDYWGYYTRLQTNTSLTPSLFVNPSNPLLPTYKIQASATPGTDYTISLPGANRMADPDYTMTGTLNKITYPEGGSTVLGYELNDYYDPTSATVIRGGGIRVKTLTDNDSSSVNNTLVKSYTYVNPSTGLSSGKPVSLPVFAFVRPYTGTGTTADVWNYSTIRSENDQATEDGSVIYSHVKVSQSGEGSSLYEYAVPGTNWEVSTSPEWSPTVNYSARMDCSLSNNTRNGASLYPFGPNTNFDFERGLLKKVVHYDQSNKEVSESSYTYQLTGQPLTVTGLRVDSNQTSRVYAKYKIYTSSSEQLVQETKTVFESSASSPPQQQVTTLNYVYGSAYHKLLTQQSSTNSDGSILTNYISYAKDYTIPATTDPNLLAIENLRLLNINVPIESRSTVQRDGITKTIKAELTKFKSFPAKPGWPLLYLPTQKLQLVSPTGLTDFQPFSSASGAFIKDARYIQVENDTDYDQYGFLLTRDDGNKNIQTVLTNRFLGLPEAVVTGAVFNELAFNDFESINNGIGFAGNNLGNVTDNHTGRKALSLNASETLTATVQKSPRAQNYVFSCWIKSAAAGSLNLILTSGGTNYPYTVAYAADAAKWRYCEITVPVGALTGSILASFQGSTQFTVDDILFYPENASVSTSSYDFASHQKTSEIDASGITTYYSFDPYGRLNNIKDQDKQIVLAKSYIRKSQMGPPPPFVTVNFSESYVSGKKWEKRQIQFINVSTINNPNASDIVYTWDFGDGSATVTGLNSTHTYAAAGTYTVALTATSALYGVLSTSRQQVIETLPAATVTIRATNHSNGASITNVTLKQNGIVIYSIKGVLLGVGSNVVPDKYDIELTVSGPSGSYNSVRYTGHIRACFPTSGGSGANTYTLSDDLSAETVVVFDLETMNCDGTGGSLQ
ncbi:YD repeat-containing protein [Pedobacter sp. W3I1]|uniref:PKD domain-containing protein n=1 Tax=Pedobacter sp. W3I1 TaxID=3042291 RepID=UPI00277F380E|nr:PKD domain-containing protein [Pedobacter sp. W3I1]MDQ0640170.1 YD repeat-containing protein [Pedobacter sp. W3I1]